MVVVALWFVPGASSSGRTVAFVAGASVGALVGYLDWRQVQGRIFAGNRVILYYQDSFTYAVLVQLGIASFFPVAALRGAWILAGHPSVFLLAVSGIASAILGMSTISYLLVRHHDLRAGPLMVKTLYARSVTGSEGMLGKRAIVVSVHYAEATVRVASELWRARPLGATELHPGDEVVIRDVAGLCLLVERPHVGAE